MEYPMMKLRIRSRASSCQIPIQSARTSDSSRDDPICHGCGKPMKLVRRFKETGDRQVWYCSGCLVFRIIVPPDYIVDP
jgi:hypothetical protein